MVKIERTPTAPASLAIEKEKGTSKYNGFDVMEALNRDFRGKCYICEIDGLQTVQVEHLRPHCGGKNRDLMFAWDNLFLSCGHCNNVKNKKKYEDSVIDCCKEDPEYHIKQELIDGHVHVTPLDALQESAITAELITECFEEVNTGTRTLESRTRIIALSSTMNTLFKQLKKYKKDKKPSVLRTLHGMLDRSYKFAGFTRTYVRDHLEEYPDFEQDVSL